MIKVFNMRQLLAALNYKEIESHPERVHILNRL